MQMKKFINDPDNLTAELLEGLALANPDILELGEDNMVINKKLAEADRVTIVTQGGSSHEPAIEGFVGEGMVDIDVVGDIFAAPGPQACVDAIKLADKCKGVLYIVLNHAGDMLTGNMTMKQCKKQGLNVVKVVTQEDVSNAPRENADDRRGLVGCIPTYKIAGAAAAEGRSLEEVAAVAQRFADNMATLAVAVRGATHPQTGTLLAELGDDEMEIGMGQHGEEGGGRQPLKSADETAAIMVNALVKDIGIEPGERVMLIINGSGATTLMEQLIVYRAAVKELAKQDIEVVANFVGEMLTVQEQAGFQMFMARMDDELLRLWNAPCTTPYLKKYGRPMLVSLRTVLAWAEENDCAAAAFDTPNLELLLAAIGAAEERDEPVIIQHAQLHEEETSIDVIGPIMVARAEASRVPVCVMLDHGEDIDYVRRALDLGFSAVMIDGSQLPYEENVALTLGAVELAREYGADVEAEIGFTTGHEGLEMSDDDRENVYTDPDEAARFVADTGINALAASVGTVHGFYQAQPKLDFKLIEELRIRCGVPLVMHGGSGLSCEDTRAAIRAGIRKINYFSYMSNAGVRAVEALIAEKHPKYFHALANAATAAMQADAEAAMDMFSMVPSA